jgi:formate-dependent nitrite reductase membrane component NrfD
MDPKANGQLQRHWGWLIAIYLFLGGVGAGAYAIAAINSFLGKEMELSTRVGFWIGFPALLIGSICLLADLGTPARAVLSGIKVRTSWIARGVWIISAFMILSFLHLVLFLGGQRIASEGGMGLSVIAILGIITAFGTMAYTGLLLGASKGIPFWRTGMVPVVFVVSALVTGHCAIMLGMAPFGGGPEMTGALSFMGLEAAVLVALEILVIALYLYSVFKEADARESAERILANRAFVNGYFVLGLAVPLVLMIYLSSLGAGATVGRSLAVAVIGALLGLIGGLILRWAVLKAGTLPTWYMAGIEFRRIARPKDPKPGIGLMPPS